MDDTSDKRPEAPSHAIGPVGGFSFSPKVTFRRSSGRDLYRIGDTSDRCRPTGRRMGAILATAARSRLNPAAMEANVRGIGRGGSPIDIDRRIGALLRSGIAGPMGSAA